MSTNLTTDAPETPVVEASVVPLRMPRAEGLPAPTPDDGRNPIFGLLVRDDADMAGLLAYALYKQNKRNWLIAFQEVLGRAPTPDETSAFILGERLPGRVEAYRRLADEMLAKRDEAATLRLAPERAANDPRPAAKGAEPAPTATEAIRRISWRQLGLLLLLVVGMAAVFRVLGAWLFRP